MSANVETMFYTRVTPWHGLGTRVEEAPCAKEALALAGLDWRVVTDRYKVVQNEDAFAFTDELLGEGVSYETAGSLQGGRRTWILAKLPQRYMISGDEVTPYLVFMNPHDGNGAIKAAMTPVRAA